MIKSTIGRLRAAAPAVARDFAGLGGCAMIATGAGLIYVPAGLIVGGLMLVIMAVISGRVSA